MAATPDPNVFGPQLDGRFDFTLYFEHAVLSIIPSSLFLALAPVRLAWLFRQPCLVRTGWLLLAKLALALLLFSLELTLVVLWARPSTSKNAASLPATILELLCTTLVALLLYAKHKHSVRPSKLLSIYLFVSVLVGLAHARSLFLLRPQGFASIARIFTATLVAKAALLLLEEFPKTPFLIQNSGSTPVEAASGPLNRSVFWWLNPLFTTGARRLLQVQDLGSIDCKFDSTELLSALRDVWTRCDKSAKHCLLSSTLIAYKVGYLTPVIPRLCLAGFSFSQPFLIKRVIEYVSQPVDSQSNDTAAGLIAAAFLIYLGLAISRCIYNHSTYQLSTTLRGGLVSLIFGRLLELKATTASGESSVTLMSTDIDSIASGVNHLHEIWASILELGVAIYLLNLEIGAACFVVAIPAVVCSLVMDRATDGIGPAKMAWNQGVQKRVSRTSSVLSQIKGIMMMGLSDYLSSIIHNMRVSELDLSKKFRMFIVRINLIANISDQMTPMAVVTAAVFWTRADGFSVSQAFTSLGIVALVSTPLATLTSSYPMFVSSVACFGRIQEFLLTGERVDDRVKSIAQAGVLVEKSSDAISSSKESPALTPKSTAIELTSLTSSKGPENAKSIVFESATLSIDESAEPILKDITLSFNRSKHTAIIGPVGCGKSTILKAILGEVRVTKGNVRVAHDEHSIAYCSQSTWLQNLSVKANIIRKGPFDRQWYTTVIRACALEEDISRFPKGEDTLIGSGGITLSGGQKQRVALARALYSRRPIVLLDDIFSALDATTSKAVFTRVLGPGGLLRQNKTTVVLATSGMHFLPCADEIVMLDNAGKCHRYDSFSAMQSENPAMMGLESQEKMLGVEGEPLEEENEASNSTLPPNPDVDEENTTQRQAGDLSLHMVYLRSMGPKLSVLFALFAVGFIGLGMMPTVWLRLWTEHGTDGPDRGGYFGAYLAFSVGAIIFSALVVWLFFVVVIPRSAIQLHRQLLDSVMNAPFWFFTTVDSGVTLNRFSQDMTLVDQALPTAFFELTLDTLVVLAAAALIASGAQYFSVVIPFCVVPLYFLQKYYLRTSRQMRHLDLESKSPLYTHFTETSAGLVTIRAFGWQREFVEAQLHLLDISQKPYYLMFCLQRWLGVVLDLFVVGIATIFVAFAVKMTGTTSSGAAGLAMVNLIELNTSLSRVINAWTNLETSLGAIARLRDFTRDTPREDDGNAQPRPSLPQDWPFSGNIKISEVNATYNDPADRVLRDLSLSIKPGQKVGICGRTGSGKTSLLLAILQMLQVRSGSICVDDIDVSAHARQSVRRQITTLPQDAVTLPGTVRANLDPYGFFDGEGDGDKLVAALDRVSLWDGVIGPRGGLDADLEGLGLSHGQMQLFGLARALLHKDRTRLLLLDEATSSVDRETDARLQAMIREDFAACTVVAVTHRLETVQHYDAVVVIERGMVAEMGNPRRLMEDRDSAFYRLMSS